MPDLEVSKLPALAGGALQATDPLPLADLSASETKKITAKDLVQFGVALIDDGSIPSTKLNFTLPAGSVGTLELADGSVTAPKLADNSSVVVGAPAAGEFIGQMGYEVSTGLLRVWDGGTWQAPKAAGSINLINADTTGVIRSAVTQVGDTVTIAIEPANTTGARQFLAGPTAVGGAVSARAITGADLPAATNGDKGAVLVSGNGLKMIGDVLAVDNTVIPSVTYGVVTYNAQGLVTAGRALSAPDLPVATTTAIGAIKPSPEFIVDGIGTLSHANAVTPGVGVKLVWDARGHITGTQPLDAADIPSLDASKITSGEFLTARIADRSITALKLADYATAYIQDVQPPNAGNTIGQLWLNPLAQQIRMWDGNVWVPIGVGALSEQNLRFCGLFDASDGKITILTPFGRDAGYKVGDVLPVATDQLTGSYFVCDTAGNGTAVTAGVTYDPGDWCVCLGVAQGWARIDTLSGAGGGGGSSTLNGLIDVDVPTPGAGQVLEYDGAIWKAVTLPDATETAKGRIELATQAEVDAGTDTVRAVTPATLKQYVATASPAPVDATTTVKGVVQLAAAADITAGAANRVVTADQLKTTNDALATATAGGLSNVTGTAPVVVTGTGNTRDVSVSDASETAKGIVELATIAEVTTGTDTVRAVTPAGAKAVYLPLDFTTLAVLP